MSQSLYLELSHPDHFVNRTLAKAQGAKDMATPDDCTTCPYRETDVINRDNLYREVQPIIKATVRETLTVLGADPENPLEMQRDFAYMRTARVRHNSLYGTLVQRAVVGLFTVTIMAALAWFGIGLPH